ncbi:hypothetical protein BgiMline_021267, partial [Biomphalaria glabrata]
FDQSALSMIVTKLFVNERYRYHMPGIDNDRYIAINRGQRDPTYFDEVLKTL